MAPTPIAGAIVNIFQLAQHHHTLTGQIAERIGARMRRRPSNATKGQMLALGLTEANEPIAAIERRAENSIVCFQRFESCFYICRDHFWRVASYEHKRPRRHSFRQMRHALAKVTLSLTDHEISAKTLHRLIGRDCQAKPPTWIRAHTLQKPPERDALKTVRRTIPDISRQAAFALAKNWLPRHQHESTLTDHKDVQSVQSARQH